MSLIRRAEKDPVQRPPVENLARSLLVYGDVRLRLISEPVTEISDSIRGLVLAMWHLMHQCKGIGIAAPQMGAPVRVIVIGYGVEETEILAMINPKIVQVDGEQASYEGCLSVEKSRWGEKVKRAKRLKVEYIDIHGRAVKLKAHARLAAVIQHEIDHLDGVLYTDKSVPKYQ